MNGIEWDSPQLVKEYTDKIQDKADWYEHEVNMPSLLSLMPKGTKTILDFGCGPGHFTAELADLYDVMGVDRSPAMLATAANVYPDLSFLQWDGQSPFSGNQKFDVLFSKLALHFIEDLGKFAQLSRQVLNTHGCIIVSVQHPLRSMQKVGGDYLQTSPYRGGSSKYGLQYTMIHRNFEEYTRPFLENGFVVTGLLEPAISKALAKKYEVAEDAILVPKRLNLRFEYTG